MDGHPHNLTRRAFLRAAGAAAAGAALAACVPAGARPDTPAAPVQLVYQDWRTDWFPPMAQQMLEQFNAAHPSIRVFYVPDPEHVEDQMLADMQAGRAADVFQGCCTHFPIWAQKGYTLDLRPFVAEHVSQADVADWDTAQYRSFFTAGGLQYGLPKYHGALALYYNKDLFDVFRVDYPDGTWDHDDYLQAMKALTRDLNGDGRTDLWGSMVDVSWDRIQVHVNAWGGHFVDPQDPARCLMGEPEALAAMEWLRARIWDDGVMATVPRVGATNPREAFIAGRIAMAEEGSWSLKDILAGAKFRIGVAPFPAGPARRVTLATTDGFGIYSGTRYPAEAWELMQFLISPDYGRAMARANFLQPARSSLVDQWIGYIREQYPAQARDVDLAAFADGHRKGYSVIAEIFANMEDARTIAYEAWDRIFTLGQAPVDLMKDAARRIQAAQAGGS